MSLIKQLSKLKEQYGSHRNIPLSEYKVLLGLDVNDPVSNGTIIELLNCKFREELAFLHPESTMGYDENDNVYNSGQTHQRFREVIRERILGKLQDSGRITKERE